MAYPIIKLLSAQELLEVYSWAFKRRTLKLRKELEALKETVETLNRPVYDACWRELAQLTRLANERQANQQGTPSTESQDPYTSTNVIDRKNPADMYLLKKAYRYAARISHPDAGGSPEEFHLVHTAYKQGDLAALQEYAISRNKSPAEQFYYWHAESQRPHVRAEEFRQTHAFAMARLVSAGRHADAERLLKSIIAVKTAELLTTRGI